MTKKLNLFGLVGGLILASTLPVAAWQQVSEPVPFTEGPAQVTHVADYRASSGDGASSQFMAFVRAANAVDKNGVLCSWATCGGLIEAMNPDYEWGPNRTIAQPGDVLTFPIFVPEAAASAAGAAGDRVPVVDFGPIEARLDRVEERQDGFARGLAALGSAQGGLSKVQAALGAEQRKAADERRELFSRVGTLEGAGSTELTPPLSATVSTAALGLGLSEAQAAKVAAWYQENHSWALPIAVILAIIALVSLVKRVGTAVQTIFGRTLEQRVTKLEKGRSTDPKTEERLTALEGQVNHPETGLAATHDLAKDAKSVADEIRQMALEQISWDRANAGFDTLSKLPVGAETWWGCTYNGEHYRIRLWRNADTKAGEICTNIMRDHASGLLADPISLKRLKLRIAGAIYSSRLSPDVPEAETPPVRLASVDGMAKTA